MREELELRKSFLALCRDAHITKVEPSIGSSFGTPDVNLGWRKAPPCWVEFKLASDVGIFLMRRTQVLWLKEHAEYNQDAFVVPLSQEGFWIIKGWDETMIGYGTQRSVTDYAAPFIHWDKAEENIPLIYRQLQLGQ